MVDVERGCVGEDETPTISLGNLLTDGGLCMTWSDVAMLGYLHLRQADFGENQS